MPDVLSDANPVAEVVRVPVRLVAPLEGKGAPESQGDEGQSFAKILAAVESAGLASSHTHLEVYLSDPRRTAQTKLRTVLLLELEEG